LRKVEGKWAPELTEKKQRFLSHYVVTGTVLGAAALAGIGGTTHYMWLQESPLYAKEFKRAQRYRWQLGMTVARRLAIYGVKRKKFTAKGEPIIDPETKKQYFEIEYNTRLLLRILEIDYPKKFAKRAQVEHDHKEGVTVTISRAAIEQHKARLAGRPPVPKPVLLAKPVNGNGRLY
jgi:hypothetical protein